MHHLDNIHLSEGCITWIIFTFYNDRVETRIIYLHFPTMTSSNQYIQKLQMETLDLLSD